MKWAAALLASLLLAAAASDGHAQPATTAACAGETGDGAHPACGSSGDSSTAGATTGAADDPGPTPSIHKHAANALAAEAYAAGKKDRQKWESWLAGLSGDYLAGAQFWAGQRSLPKRVTCATGGGTPPTDAWRSGCSQAQAMLMRPDQLRRRSRSYRRGWNSVEAAPPAPVAAPPTAPTPSPVPLLLVVLAIGSGVAFFIIRALGRSTTSAAPARQAATARPLPIQTPRAAVPTTVRTAPPVVALSARNAAALRSDSERSWRSAGQPVTVGDVVINGGLIYVGQSLQRGNGYGGPDNCLIDPTLDIRAGNAAIDPDQGLPYWPSYSSLPAPTRRAHLQWLASDRANPQSNIGYVFLYFYGLERRLMLDRSALERDTIVAEVTRLQGVYGESRSFRRYSERLLEADRIATAVFDAISPPFQKEGYDLPLGLRVALGRFVARDQPIPADWMLSWVMCDPQLYIRTPATRDLEVFREVFADRWDKVQPGGVTFGAAAVRGFPRLKAVYQASSNSFRVDVPISEDLPDVAGARQFVTKAHALALECCEELDAYSRLIGRHAELKGTIAAAALAPPQTSVRAAAAAAVTAFARAAPQTTAASIVKLVDPTATTEKLSITQWRKTAEALGKIGFGVAPDPDLALTRIAPETSALLYPLPDGSSDVPQIMSAAALVLQIGALVAGADGFVADGERAELQHAALVPSLDARQQARLSAQANWLIDTPTRPTDLKARLADAAPDVRAWIVDVALDVAKRDGRIVAAEVKQLEKVFDWLGLPSTQLYSALHGSEPVEIAAAVEAPAGQAIPAMAAPRRALSQERIAAITRESAKSAVLLQSVFGEADEEPEPAIATEIETKPSADPAFAGLSESLTNFAHAVCERDSWTRPDLEAVANAHKTMLDGAIERLNDWALDRWDDLLIEDEGPALRVNRQHLAQAAEAL